MRAFLFIFYKTSILKIQVNLINNIHFKIPR